MNVELTSEDIETLLTSLDYSKDRVRNSPDTPAEVRRGNLARLDAVTEKLRTVRRASGTA
jgi:hypothetical protein